MKTTISKPLIFKLLIPSFILMITTLSVFASSFAQPVSDDLLFSTYLGGELTDQGAAIVVDEMGYVYITGSTQSTIFPAPLFSKESEHGVDVFIAKIDPTGENIVYSLWFNAASSSLEDEGFGIAVDEAGHTYVSGYTRSADFCSVFGQVPGYDTTYNENSDAFLLKVKEDGSGLVYCTYLGGSDWDAATDVIVDKAGNATLTGETWSTDFPTTSNAHNQEINGQRDVFLAKINTAGTVLEYSTYLGGSGQEKGSALVKSG